MLLLLHDDFFATHNVHTLHKSCQAPTSEVKDSGFLFRFSTGRSNDGWVVVKRNCKALDVVTGIDLLCLNLQIGLACLYFSTIGVRRSKAIEAKEVIFWLLG